MKSSLRALLLLSPLAALAGALACSSGSGSTPPAGGSPSDSGPPTYCSAYAAWAKECFPTDPCITALSQGCTGVETIYSSSYQSAFIACQPKVACTLGADAGVMSECLVAAAVDAGATPALTKLAQDYCTACAAPPLTVTSCEAQFNSTFDDGGAFGYGLFYAGYTDAIVQAIDGTCGSLDGGLVCGAAFTTCAGAVVTGSYSAPAACANGVVADAGGD
jgi:hypothetical protein